MVRYDAGETAVEHAKRPGSPGRWSGGRLLLRCGFLLGFFLADYDAAVDRQRVQHHVVTLAVLVGEQPADPGPVGFLATGRIFDGEGIQVGLVGLCHGLVFRFGCPGHACRGPLAVLGLMLKAGLPGCNRARRRRWAGTRLQPALG
jgi:hypothetical protein